jgi:hypothetical protein
MALLAALHCISDAFEECFKDQVTNGGARYPIS